MANNTELSQDELLERKKLLERKLEIEETLAAEGGGAFVESKDPVFGGVQVSPESPLSFTDRFKLGLASPEGRRVIGEKFGHVIGAPGSEIIQTEEGFNAVNPKGFDFGDIPEAIGKAPGFTGQIAGGVLGGIAGGVIGHPLKGAAVGAAALTSAGEFQSKMVGKVLGLRPEDSVSRIIADSLLEGAKAGALEFAAGGAFNKVPVVGKTVGGVLNKAKTMADDVIRSLGKVSKMSSNWLKTRVKTVGPKEVFTSEKIKADYAGNTLLPRIKEGVNNLVTNFTDDTSKMLKSNGVSDKSVEVIGDRSYDAAKATQERLGDSTSSLSEKVMSTLESNLDEAGKEFDNLMTSQGDDTLVKIKSFKSEIDDVFDRSGLLDKSGKFRTDVDEKLIPTELKLIRALRGEIENVTEMPVADYFRYKTILDNGVKGNRIQGFSSMDRAVMKVKNGLRNDAVESIPGLKPANKNYSRAKGFRDKFITGAGGEGKIGEKKLNSFRNLSKAQRSEYELLDVEVPFINDLEDLLSVREVDDVISKNFSDKKIESLFSGGATETKVTDRKVLSELDNILPEGNKFYNDYRDWLGHMDLQGSGIFASRGGFIKAIAEQGETQLIKRGVPVAQAVGNIVRPIAGAGKKIARTALEPEILGKKIRTLPLIIRQQNRGE